jgi:hypothetical protein
MMQVPETSLDLEFHQAMVELYVRAKAELRYNARYLIDMVANEGGRETARYLLDTKEPSDGYVILWENGRLDLSVEAEVLRPKWSDLFSDEQRAVAIRRLREYKFDVDAYLERIQQEM